MHRIVIAWIALGPLWAGGVAAQILAIDSSTVPPTATLIPGSHYAAGKLHRLFFGDHYRDVWTRPVRVPLLDLDHDRGGLVPICRGGGYQTKSLRFEAGDGRQYVFRSIDKDPTAKLPVILRSTFVADVLQDQISSHHPASAILVARLLDAGEVLHAHPRLVVMPDDHRLGPFRSEYAGIAGTLEERPRDASEGVPGFAGSRVVEATADVWDRVERGPEEQIDAHAYLRARLMDMFVGDWDRHHDQWRWARFPSDNGYLWRPIPRDRDQAFSKLDGIILDVARIYIPELVSFDESFDQIFGLTWTGRAMDRRFLSGLEKAVWDSTASALQSRLTDPVIDAAVAVMPDAIRDVNGEETANRLKARRDQLPDAAHAFYRLLAQYVDIHATDADEEAIIERGPGRSVRVRVYTVAPTPSGEKSLYFDRTFHRSETREIRLYLHGGDDRAVVGGHTDRSVLVRVIGGGGDDTMIDSSYVEHGRRTLLYDARGDNQFERGGMTSISRSRFRPPPRPEPPPLPRLPATCGDSVPDEPPRALAAPFRDWGSAWIPAVWATFQPDLGLVVGTGWNRIGYGFREAPYKSDQTLSVSLATGPRRPRVEYEGDFPGAFRRAGLHLGLLYSGVDIIRFHGFGNETTLDLPTAAYQVTLRRLSLAPSVTVGRTPLVRFSLGPRLSYAHAVVRQGTLIDSLGPYGAGRLLQVGGQASFTMDTRDTQQAATRGIHLHTSLYVAPDWLDLTGSYASLSGSFSTYLTAASLPAQPTLALRGSAMKLWGAYPFYDAAFVGGSDDVRAFSEQRFAGDAAVTGNAELRLYLTRYRLVLPGEFGVFGLGDVGRVFVKGESSRRWHSTFGGGIWFAYVERSATMTLAFASSGERRSVYLRAGFLF